MSISIFKYYYKSGEISQTQDLPLDLEGYNLKEGVLKTSSACPRL
jgi:hypothetical protein